MAAALVEASRGSVEAESETDGRRRVARDAHGWPLGIRWALGRGGAHCMDDGHAVGDYLGPNPVQAVGSPAEVRFCGECCPRAAAVRERAAA